MFHTGRVPYPAVRSVLSVVFAVVVCTLWACWEERTVGMLLAVLSIAAIAGAMGAVMLNVDGVRPEEEKYVVLFGKIFSASLTVSVFTVLSPLIYISVVGMIGVLVSAAAVTIFVPMMLIRPSGNRS